jgi:mannosyltransferase OCH1-like enzyme
MIPKIIHQIWVGPYKIPHRELMCIEKIKLNQNDFEHNLWTDNNIPNLPQKLKKIYDFLGKNQEYVYQSDLLRVYLINKYGGVYMDVDFEFKKSITEFNLEKYDAFFCTHDGNVDTFPNGIFGMSPNHPISIKMIYDMETEFPERYWYGPSWIANMIKAHFGVTEKITYDEFSKKYFDPNNIFHINYDKFHYNYYFHHALYSWLPENKKKFSEGKIL